MKKIVPVNMSRESYAEFLIKSGVVTKETYLAATIDNTYYEWVGRPERTNFPWSLQEDYNMICLLMEKHSIDFIAKVLRRSRTGIASRMVTLLGTSDWIRIVTLSDREKSNITKYFYHCILVGEDYKNRINILETVELIHFLEGCGFYGK
jgi:hypothetical protein